ncbi:MAG: DNA-protecting protein DprA [Desulfobulbaceae bacterium]|nr:DNA-protecting protein DprA [Desulfobulbaceae bacterium]
MGHLEEWLTLYLTPGLGVAGCRNLVDWFGSPERALQASRKELAAVKGLREKGLEAIGQTKPRQDAVEELRRARQLGLTIICLADREYPEWLRHIPNPPVILYIKGEPSALAAPGISIVGSRAASSYGLRMAETLAGQLAGLGLTVVSGLALGIDTAAHHGALKGGGSTVAVLGCGLDLVYPPQNRELFEIIPSRGCLVSEYPLGTQPDGFRFPARNRIISGLSRGVVVVEATLKSGSLITAELALEQGREVFAIPGRADSLKSAGCHRLLQQGAKLVMSVGDVVNEFVDLHSPRPTASAATQQAPRLTELSDEERAVMAVLEIYPRHIDEVITACRLTVNQVNELLLMLEIKGYCEVLPGQHYQLMPNSVQK